MYPQTMREPDIQALDGHLNTIVRENKQHHENLQGLLENFQGLLESYYRLKSDYEEEKMAREKYKKMARGQERNPFVLVLVDGDGYLFKDHLLKAGAEGGITAANLLSDYVKDYIQTNLASNADQCRIMVRIYSNLLGLSKSLARAGLAGHEARSISSFTSSFTRSEDLFDYVDAGDKKEGADHKIREMFRLFADNNQCKHIFFAGCHDSGYLSLLTPYRGKSDRFTLIKAASFHHEYEYLSLPIWELPMVFSSNSLGGSSNPVTTPSRPVCKHFQKGICKFGNECTKLHIMRSQQLLKNGDTPTSWVTSIPIRSQDYYAANLPAADTRSRELIAVNKDGERIDPYSPHPPMDVYDEYNRRARQHKICNKYHLGGECGDMSCPFDHSDVEPSIINVMTYILRQTPCPRKGACRSIKCYTGHHCQKDQCRGGRLCKFGQRAHTLDIRLSQWVKPSDSHEIDRISSISDDLSSGPGSSADELSVYDMA